MVVLVLSACFAEEHREPGVSFCDAKPGLRPFSVSRERKRVKADLLKLAEKQIMLSMLPRRLWFRNKIFVF